MLPHEHSTIPLHKCSFQLEDNECHAFQEKGVAKWTLMPKCMMCVV